MNTNDLISRAKALDTVRKMYIFCDTDSVTDYYLLLCDAFEALPSAQPTLYGYNIGNLELIARVLQKEDLPTERVAEALTDIDRIIAIVKDEFEETLRKAVEQCMI